MDTPIYMQLSNNVYVRYVGMDLSSITVMLKQQNLTGTLCEAKDFFASQRGV